MKMLEAAPQESTAACAYCGVRQRRKALFDAGYALYCPTARWEACLDRRHRADLEALAHAGPGGGPVTAAGDGAP